MRILFAQTADRLLQTTVTPAIREIADDGKWPEAVWQEIENSGLTMALVSEEFGGAGATFNEAFPIAIAAGKFAVPVPLVENVFANYFLDQAGLAPRQGITSLAHEALDLVHGTVSGTLTEVPWGRRADHVLCLARHGNALHLVLLATAEAAHTEPGLNIAREPRDRLTFSKATPMAIAALPSGLDDTALLRAGALMRSGQIAGALETLTIMSSEYANQREQFGRPIAKFQAIQQMIAQLAEQSVLAYTAADRAFDETAFVPGQLAVSVAKTISGESASAGASFAHSVHGAIGFTHEHSLHHYTRRLWSWRAEFGSATYWADLLGMQACSRGAGSIWPAITRNSWA